MLTITERTFMQELRGAAKEIADGSLSPYWVRAYEALSDAADRLDAMMARSDWFPPDGMPADDMQNAPEV